MKASDRLDIAQAQASQLGEDAPEWISRVQEVRDLLSSDPKGTDRLAQLVSEYAADFMGQHDAQMTAFWKGERFRRRGIPYELLLVIEEALLELGTAALDSIDRSLADPSHPAEGRNRLEGLRIRLLDR